MLNRLIKSIVVSCCILLNTYASDSKVNNEIEILKNNNFQQINEVDGIKVILISNKDLIVGNNKLKVSLLKENTIINDAKVKIKFFMPEMPGMAAMENEMIGVLENDKYNFDINLQMSGTWQYQLKVKTIDNKIHTIKGSVNL